MSYSSAVLRHNRTKEKPYMCKQCDKCFMVLKHTVVYTVKDYICRREPIDSKDLIYIVTRILSIVDLIDFP